jgi:hypothetical protein
MTMPPSSTHPRIGWKPETRPGRWCLWLAGIGLGGVAALAAAFAVGLEPADSFTDNWLLSSLGVALLASGAGSAATGSVALLRHRERSWLVLGATAVGVLVTALVLQQVAEGLGWLGA